MNGCSDAIISGATGLRGPKGLPGTNGSGRTVVVAEDYTVQTGDGFAMVDLRAGTRQITLSTLSADTEVLVKDDYGLATDGVVISVVGTLDDQTNPNIVSRPYDWAWLKFTLATGRWSLIG